MHLVDEFPLLAGWEHELPQELRSSLSAAQLRKLAKIVHARFD